MIGGIPRERKAEPVGFRWRLYSQDERGFFILKKILTVRNISTIAVLGALGAVLMLFDFPIFIAPSFYKLDLGAFVGEIAAFIFSSVYCMTAALIYQSDRSRKGAIKAMIVASLAMMVFATIGNYAFIIPAYVKMYNMPLEAIIGMGTKIFPIVHDKLSFVLCCVMPFNLIKAIIVDVLTLVLYKRVSVLLKQAERA